ncbi:hypothetical protein OG264_32340 [Streptomyces xanthophaeus]|uniref:hypothetical protein n=1 Tax=Streptomyces xanthophaeus TaxID=67385 RepID=UPI003868D677|nr:hypothetical protein OG264_32340 [Streptomyces xanthophaeus]WST59231.1 hypothetical protein OG605_06100 [Streptomyces xanthophaeus]
MASVEETDVHGLLDWVCDLHSLNSVLASVPATGAVPRLPAEPESAVDSRQWATHLVAVWSRLATPVTARPETGSV